MNKAPCRVRYKTLTENSRISEAIKDDQLTSSISNASAQYESVSTARPRLDYYRCGLASSSNLSVSALGKMRACSCLPNLFLVIAGRLKVV